MSKVLITSSKLDALANTISTKSGAALPLTLDQMDAAVQSIDLTTGSVYQDQDGFLVVDDGESSAPQGNISITANGTYDVAQYAGANVEVPVGMSETDLSNFIQRNATFTDIDWPDGITKIGSHAFANCLAFNPPSLPSGITSIGSYAFYQCEQLTLTELPSGITYIGDYAFQWCYRLALTSLPSGITEIRQYVFYECKELALTELPSGITSIGTWAFYKCHDLALTELPSGVTQIGLGAFCSCDSIPSISCEGAIKTLTAQSFNGSSTYPMSLRSVSFPNMALTSNLGAAFGSTTAASACQLLEFCDIGSTTGIAANAFANCYALETLVLRKTASVCTLSNVSAFTNTPLRGYDGKTGKVYVPSALIESYKTATNWATLYNAGTVEFVAIEGSEYERD